jgi:hypothetical protein
MFYAESTSNALRFGDVLRGYFSTTPIIKEPALEEPFKQYNIDVNLSNFSVVMDPCCQIGNKAISLTPLIPIYGSFSDNPYLAEDLTNVNRKMKPELSMPPHTWEQLPSEKKQERAAVGIAYAFVNFFVYEGNDRLPKYIVHRKEEDKETNFYMINFRDIHKLCCDKINTPEDSPLKSKVLELSVETRRELREKLATYYGTPPKEDRVLLEA